MSVCVYFCVEHEKVLLMGRLGEIRGVDLDSPLEPLIPTVSGPAITAPSVIQLYHAEGAIYWADSEVGSI